MASLLLEPLWTAAQARAADAYTIEDLGVPGIVLMEHAGRCVAEIVKARHPELTRGRGGCIVFAGPGNNGGDGWVAARHLWGAGIPCPVVTLKSPEALLGDASLAAQMFLTAAEARGWESPALGGPFFLIDLADDVSRLLEATGALVVIDAVFGTGLSRPLEGIAARVVEGLSQARVPIVAVDLPSGLPTDGEAPHGACVQAAATVTFGGRKIAHASEPGHALCGETCVADVGILSPHEARPAAFRLLDASPLLPAADPSAHKNSYGHVGVLVGKARGAARLAGLASLRAGAGLCSLLATDTAGLLVEPELMARPLDPAALAEALDKLATLVVGPGLGHDNAERARALLELAAARALPVVVDAEAIDALARAPIAGLRAVVTPHPGEAARVLGTTSAEVQQDRLAAVRALRQKLGDDVVVVLKGSCPLVAGGLAGEDAVIVVEGGAPALAVAGSGDVLAGAIGGLLARGLPVESAALAAVAAHQAAGRALGSRGRLAREIAEATGHVLAGKELAGAGTS